MANGNDEDRRFLRKLNCNYLVLDEGHMLKNMQSQRYQGLMRMKVRWRPSKMEKNKIESVEDEILSRGVGGGGEVLPIMAYTGRLALSPLDSAIGFGNTYSLDSDLSVG